MITAKSHTDTDVGFAPIEKWLGRQLFKSIGPAPIRFVLRDGTEISPAGSSPVGTVFIHDNRTLAKLIIDPEMAFGEAYADGRVHVDGDFVRLLEVVYQSMGAAPEGRYERLTSKLLNWWQANTLHGSRNNIHRHYDLGNDCYKLWLDHAAEGLSSRVEFIKDDYRNIPGSFDAFVSVGKLEYVDPRRFADFGEVIYRAVGDTGRGLLHFIGRSHSGNFGRWIRKRIFPGAHAPSLAEAMNILQPLHYSVLDVENLRPHYARTLEHWLDRFEASSPQVIEMYDGWFQRAWRLYLAGSIAGFRAGTLQLFQISFAGSKRQSSSWTRAPLYTRPPHKETGLPIVISTWDNPEPCRQRSD